MELLSGLLSSLGLSGAAGLNAFIPLLLVGLLSRADVVHLNAPFDLLGNPWVLLGVAVVLPLLPTVSICSRLAFMRHWSFNLKVLRTPVAFCA